MMHENDSDCESMVEMNPRDLVSNDMEAFFQFHNQHYKDTQSIPGCDSIYHSNI